MLQQASPLVAGYAFIQQLIFDCPLRVVIPPFFFSPESYLFMFLKFLQSVVPTIDYDFTNVINAGRVHGQL